MKTRTSVSGIGAVFNAAAAERFRQRALRAAVLRLEEQRRARRGQDVLLNRPGAVPSAGLVALPVTPDKTGD